MIAPTTPMNWEFEFISVLDYRVFGDHVVGATNPLPKFTQPRKAR